jgi:YesN/AraC family two-component response regulator
VATTAEDGREAIVILARTTPDVVLLDLKMPTVKVSRS